MGKNGITFTPRYGDNNSTHPNWDSLLMGGTPTWN